MALSVSGAAPWSANSAFAQADPNQPLKELSEAEGKFDIGMDRMERGDYEGACRAFAKSDALEPAVASKYQLGRCRLAQKRYASARTAFADAAKLASDSGDAKRAGVARERVAEMELKAPRFLVTVPAQHRVAGLAIRRNDEALPPAWWGKVHFIDPGLYTLEASAPGYKTWSYRIDARSAGVVVQVAVPPLTSTSTTAGAVPPAGGRLERRNNALFWTGLGLTIGGPVFLAAGILGTASEEIETESGVGVAVLGTAMLGAGIPFMIIFGKKVPTNRSTVRFEPLLSPTGAGLRVRF